MLGATGALSNSTLSINDESAIIFNNEESRIHYNITPLITKGTYSVPEDTLDILTEDQNKAIDASCPTPSSDNPFVTVEALRVNHVQFGVPQAMRRTDWLLSNRKSFWDGWKDNIGTDCQPDDSMSWPDDFDVSHQVITNSHIIWPRERPYDPPPDFNASMLDTFTEVTQFGLLPVGPDGDSAFVVYPMFTGSNPAIRGEYVVAEQYSDSLGTLTGYSTR
jgi:hypothetical protein